MSVFRCEEPEAQTISILWSNGAPGASQANHSLAKLLGCESVFSFLNEGGSNSNYLGKLLELDELMLLHHVYRMW